MVSTKILIASAAVVVVASAALLVPSIASGQTFVPAFAPATVAPQDDEPGDGQGKAWGHHKDSEDFPGNNGRGRDKGDDDRDDAAQGDAPGNGQGKAWGHHKDSEDFPGNNGWGHHKDSENFPGNNGRGNGNGKDD